MEVLSVYIISDSLGETGEQVAKAVISQFQLEHYDVKRFPYVLNLRFLNEILQDAKNEKAIVLYTLVDNEFVSVVTEYCEQENIPHVDLLTPMLNAVIEKTGLEPLREPGIIRKLDETYFKRVEAIEFAVKYDDGKDPRGLLKADLVILGISRTSKTPLSMYLANKNIKVANVPLVPEVIPPKEIYDIPARKVIGLTNTPEKLNEIRQERLKALGLPNGANYATMNRILEEIDYAESIMKRIGCPIIDVSNKAIEETAEIIISLLKKNGVKVVKD